MIFNMVVALFWSGHSIDSPPFFYLGTKIGNHHQPVLTIHPSKQVGCQLELTLLLLLLLLLLCKHRSGLDLSYFLKRCIL